MSVHKKYIGDTKRNERINELIQNPPKNQRKMPAKFVVFLCLYRLYNILFILSSQFHIVHGLHTIYNKVFAYHLHTLKHTRTHSHTHSRTTHINSFGINWILLVSPFFVVVVAFQ